MDQEVGARVRGPYRGDVIGPDSRMDVAFAVPDVNRAPDRLLDVGAEEHVRAEQDLDVVAVLAEDVIDDRDRVRRRAAVVGLGLDLGGRVDVHDDDRAGVARLPLAQLGRRDRIGQRAAGIQIRDQDALVGAQDGSGLGHEVHAAEDDRLGVGRGRALGEPQRVADIVGHVLDLGQLVVVGEDHRALLYGQCSHLLLEGGDVLEHQRRAGRAQHRKVHGSGVRIRDRSSAGALCVSAPIETKSTPVDATALSVASVTPPLASSFARPATCVTASRS